MSQGRKVLRVLKFVDEVKELQKVWSSFQWPNFLSILQLLSHFSSLCFFLCDNLVWASSIGLVKNAGFKKWKDVFSLCRCLLELIISLMTRRAKIQEIQKHKKSFKEYPDYTFTNRSPSFDSLEKTLNLRKELRYIRCRFVQNIFRLCMLIKSLKLPSHERLSSVFISVCGIVNTALTVVKILIRA